MNSYPSTTDVGLSLGYKLDDKNVVGVGLSYKIGWGSGFNHIQVSSQGIGLRSFLDINLMKNTFISGGFEYNYQKPFNSVSQLWAIQRLAEEWPVGDRKDNFAQIEGSEEDEGSIAMGFPCYQQIPQTQPFIFRIGYTF